MDISQQIIRQFQETYTRRFGTNSLSLEILDQDWVIANNIRMHITDLQKMMAQMELEIHSTRRVSLFRRLISAMA